MSEKISAEAFTATLDALCATLRCTYSRSRGVDGRITYTLHRETEAVSGTDRDRDHALAIATAKAHALNWTTS